MNVLNSLNSQPLDILKKIYNYLPKKEQIAVAPKISKVWYSIYKCECKLHSFYRKNLDEQCIVIYKLNKNYKTPLIHYHEHVNRILKLVNQNNLIALIKPIVFQNSDADLSIYWNFQQLKIVDKIRWGDLYTKLHILKNTSYPQRHLDVFIDAFSCKEAGPIFWNSYPASEIFYGIDYWRNSLMKHDLIASAIKLQTKVYIKYFAKENIKTILNKIDDIFNPQIKLLFKCNKDGYIVDQGTAVDINNKNIKPHIFSLKIKHKNKTIVLCWSNLRIEIYKEGPWGSSTTSAPFTIADFLQRQIYFLTNKKFAKQISSGFMTKFFLKGKSSLSGRTRTTERLLFKNH